MKTRLACCVLILAASLLHAATNTRERIVFDLRFVANRPDLLFLFRILNQGESSVSFSEYPLENSFRFAPFVYGQDQLQWEHVAAVFAYIPPGASRPFISLNGKQNITQEMPSEMCMSGVKDCFHKSISTGIYSVWDWNPTILNPATNLVVVKSPFRYVGFIDTNGMIAPPAVEIGAEDPAALMALVLRDTQKSTSRNMVLEKDREVAFLLLNGTDKEVTAANPLTMKSAVLATVSALGYSNTLVLANSAIVEKTIAPGAHGEWRMPLQAVLDLIPKEIVDKLRADGGDLDLVWKVGEVTAPVMPLTFYPPSQDELDEAFLKKHANVPKVTEKTTLSFNLRVENMETKPMLIGRMKNNETNSVVADKYFFQNNYLDNDYLGSVYFERHRCASKPFLISIASNVLFGADLVELMNETKRRTNELSGYLINYTWECFTQHTGNIWLAFPNQAEKIGSIYACDQALVGFSAFDWAYKGKPWPEHANIPALPSVAPILAFVYNGDKPHDLAFVLWNRTDQKITASNPLTPGSRIMASAPAIKYTRELSMPDVKVKERKIAPNTHTDWRLPWKTVIDLIPADDLAKIKAAGGELDLIWKVGDWESTPLPVLITDPVNE